MTTGEMHDHQSCMEAAQEAAERLAADRGVKLTPLRQQVLTLICQSHRPVGAYQLLADMARVRQENVAPPTVYRALEFLVEHGLAHRIDSLNAFVACFSPAKPHHSFFLLCERCHEAREISEPLIPRALDQAAASQGFTTTRQVVELHGLCMKCGKN